MKTQLIKLLALGIFILLVPSCLTDDVPNPLPDLDPNTTGGGDILIYSIDDILTWYDWDDPRSGSDAQIADVERIYDWNGDGSPDLSLITRTVPELFFGDDRLELRFVGELLYTNYIYEIFFPDYPVFLSANALIGGNIQGRWKAAGQPLAVMTESYTELGGIYSVLSYVPDGVSYIPTRTDIGGQWYYGWLEVAAGDDDGENFLYISRFGISQTPGLRIRMGQE